MLRKKSHHCYRLRNEKVYQMKTNIYSLDGKVLKQIALPSLFSQAVREDLIKRAVLSDESKEYQPKGSYKFAGLETSAKYRGRKEMYGAVKNKGIPHLPHEVQPKGQFGKVKRVPHAVKGRRAHPPKPEKIIIELVNKKEYTKAIISALSASGDKKLVSLRSSENFEISFPVVMDEKFDHLKKTKDVVQVFEMLQLSSLMAKSKQKGLKGPLVIFEKDVPALRAARNIAGVDAVLAKDLKVKHLAPGCKAGRLVVFTEKSLSALEKTLTNESVKVNAA